MSIDNFEWDDEKLVSLISFYNQKTNFLHHNDKIKEIVQEFKQSKTIPKKEKEYEVLYRSMVDCQGNTSIHPVNDMCNDGKCKINSVKRLSDNSVWTIGDKFTINYCKTTVGEVWGFDNNIDGDFCVKYFNGIVKLKKIQKLKDPQKELSEIEKINKRLDDIEKKLQNIK